MLNPLNVSDQHFQVINRALRVLSACTQAVIRATDETALLQMLCELITQEGTYRMAWIGYKRYDAAKTVEPIAWAGYESGYLQTVNITWADTEWGRGPTGCALRSGQPVACQNMLTDPDFAPWRALAQQRGYQSSAVLPLLENGEVFGALNIYSAEADAFNPQELQLLAELADSLSFGILTLRAEQKRQQVEQALRISEDKFAKAFDFSPLAKVITTVDEGRCLDVNHEFEALFGYSKAEMIGHTTVALGIWPCATARQQMIEQLRSQGRLRNYEAYLKNRFGEEILCHICAEPIQIDHEACILCSVDNITQRRQAELALRQSEQRFATAFQSSPVVMLITQIDTGRILNVNQQWEIHTGYSPAESIGRTTLELNLYVNPQERQRLIDQLLVKGWVHDWELQIRQKSGEIRLVLLSVSTIEVAGEVVLLTAIQDITERKQAEALALQLNQELESRVIQRTAELTQATEQLEQLNQELARSNQELEQFAYVASHDLQEPLRAVTGYTQLLLSEYGDGLDSTAQSYADFVVEGAKRMQQLIQDLLTYSRVGTRGKEFALTDCNRVIQQALRNLQLTISESQAVITVDDLPTLQADHNQLVQLFQNLVSNAIKFQQGQVPTVQIRATQQERDWLFQVQDNGIGIKSQYLDRIFEVFKRLHTRREYPGTGIGLAICKKIVMRHGGNIWAESEAGQGTTFYFTIPRTTYE